jgi:hypothetical protein
MPQVRHGADRFSVSGVPAGLIVVGSGAGGAGGAIAERRTGGGVGGGAGFSCGLGRSLPGIYGGVLYLGV